MGFLAVLVNSLAIVVGGFLGLIFRKQIKDEICQQILKVIGIVILIIGISGSLTALGDAGSSSNQVILITLCSLALGTFVGCVINIDRQINRFGLFLGNKFSAGDSFLKGFVSASLVFCVGAMAIIGGIEAGRGNLQLILFKSVIDGITAMFLASSFGIGVLIAAIPTFLYQSIFVAIGTYGQNIDEKSIFFVTFNLVGYMIITCIGLNMTKNDDKEKIKVTNTLPALIIVCLYYLIIWLF